MISDSYDQENFNPPAAAIRIAINNKYINKSEDDILALIDTGASGSSIPKDLAKRLELQPHDFAEQFDYEDISHGWKPLYYVDLSLGSLSFNNVEVDEKDDNLFIIGRDVLNQTKLVLDGKGLLFTLEDP